MVVFIEENEYQAPQDLIFREVWSGTTLERPALEEARQLARTRNFDALIAYATDRLARNPIHLAIIAEECEKHHIELLFVTEPLDSSPEGLWHARLGQSEGRPETTQRAGRTIALANSSGAELVTGRVQRRDEEELLMFRFSAGPGKLSGHIDGKAHPQDVVLSELTESCCWGILVIRQADFRVCPLAADCGIRTISGGCIRQSIL